MRQELSLRSLIRRRATQKQVLCMEQLHQPARMQRELPLMSLIRQRAAQKQMLCMEQLHQPAGMRRELSLMSLIRRRATQKSERVCTEQLHQPARMRWKLPLRSLICRLTPMYPWHSRQLRRGVASRPCVSLPQLPSHASKCTFLIALLKMWAYSMCTALSRWQPGAYQCLTRVFKRLDNGMLLTSPTQTNSSPSLAAWPCCPE